MAKLGKNTGESPIKRALAKYGNGSGTAPARRHPRPSGASADDPLVPFQVWKIRRSTVDALAAAAREKGWFTSALVRKILDEWADKRRAKRAA